MNRFEEIRQTPTTITEWPVGASGIHESVLRSYQILMLTKDYLRRGVPADVLLEIIHELEQPA